MSSSASPRSRGWASSLVSESVSRRRMTADGRETGRIGKGLLVLVGVGKEDDEGDADFLSEKCVNLRIFGDPGGKMNLSVRDVNGGILAVSQFTLFADTRRGNRPGFSGAAPPEHGKALYERFCLRIKEKLGDVQTGVFAAEMAVELVNDGPVTIWMDSRA